MQPCSLTPEAWKTTLQVVYIGYRECTRNKKAPIHSNYILTICMHSVVSDSPVWNLWSSRPLLSMVPGYLRLDMMSIPLQYGFWIFIWWEWTETKHLYFICYAAEGSQPALSRTTSHHRKSSQPERSHVLVPIHLLRSHLINASLNDTTKCTYWSSCICL